MLIDMRTSQPITDKRSTRKNQRSNTKHIKSVCTFKTDNNVTALLLQKYKADIHYDTDYTTALINNSNDQPLFESLPLQDCIITTIALGHGNMYTKAKTAYYFTMHFGNTSHIPLQQHNSIADNIYNNTTKEHIVYNTIKD